MNDQLMREFLKRNQEKRLKIHCVGDAMVDEYYEVKVDRISPEHPVPVMACKNQYVRRPGGAANVAYQLAHLNVDSKLICFHDPVAIKVFDKHGVESISVEVEDACCSLPVKRRYLDSGIQVAPRLDFEIPLCGYDTDVIDWVHSRINKQINRPLPDVVIFSDYDKGFFCGSKNEILACYKGCTTIVDPKHGPLEKWKGCTIFKPNAKEAKDLTGFSNWSDQASYLLDQLECEAVVITFGGDKVAGVCNKSGWFEYIPKRAVAAKSVIGAGDCFAAFFATAIGHGFEVPVAAEIAWNAGAVYVQQRMNRPVVPAELPTDKIVSPKDLRSRDFKLVFTNGCFDILHKGHIETLKFCKSKGDKLVVALNSDESIRQLKGDNRPVMTLENRMAVLSAIECVDFVTSFDDQTPLSIINDIRPDVLVKGEDYEIENIVGSDVVQQVFRAPLVPGISSSSILNGYLEKTQPY